MKNKSSWIIVILLLLVGVTSVYVASTYAKYTETLPQRTGEATIAKWAFASDNESKTITVDFSTTYDPATLVAQRIAPGTEGGFKIEVANTNGETGVDFTMNFGNVTPAIGTFRFEVIPEPNVDSVVVSFHERKDKFQLQDFDFFETLVRDSFQFKRKNIKNNLKKYDLKTIDSILQQHGYDLTVRAEDLDVGIFVEISNALLK